MNFLADLIDKRSEQLDIQAVKASKLLPNEALWLKHKKLLHALPMDYKKTLQDKLAKEPFSVQKREYQYNFVITIKFLEYPTFRTVLQIVEHKTKGLYSVCYIAYNHQKNCVYVRQIIGGMYQV